MLPKGLASAIVVVVTLIWSANFVAIFVVPDYKSDPLVHTAFMAIVGGAFALSRTNGKDKPNDDDKDDDKASSGKHHGGPP